MFHRVATPSLAFAAVHEAVDGPRGSPHQVGAGLVVVGLLDGDGRIFDDGLHQAFHKAIEHIEVLVHIEIDLEEVRQDVGRAASGLIGADTEGEARVEEGCLGQHSRVKPTDFVVGFGVADDGSRVHLRARGRKGQDADDGQGTLDGGTFAEVEEVPGVVVDTGTGGHDLGGIDGGATAHSQQHVDVVLFAHLHAFAHGADAWVRLDAREFEQFESGFFYFFYHTVIQSHLLDGTAAVGHQHARAVFLEFCAKVFQLVAPEVNPYGNVVDEVVDHSVCVLISMSIKLLPFEVTKIQNSQSTLR